MLSWPREEAAGAGVAGAEQEQVLSVALVLVETCVHAISLWLPTNTTFTGSPGAEAVARAVAGAVARAVARTVARAVARQESSGWTHTNVLSSPTQTLTLPKNTKKKGKTKSLSKVSVAAPPGRDSSKNAQRHLVVRSIIYS